MIMADFSIAGFSALPDQGEDASLLTRPASWSAALLQEQLGRVVHHREDRRREGTVEGCVRCYSEDSLRMFSVELADNRDRLSSFPHTTTQSLNYLSTASSRRTASGCTLLLPVFRVLWCVLLCSQRTLS